MRVRWVMGDERRAMWPSRANRQGRCRKNNTDAMMLYSEQSLDASYLLQDQDQVWRDETRIKARKGLQTWQGASCC